MSVFKDFPGLENLEKLFQDFQGPARALMLWVPEKSWLKMLEFWAFVGRNVFCSIDKAHCMLIRQLVATIQAVILHTDYNIINTTKNKA